MACPSARFHSMIGLEKRLCYGIVSVKIGTEQAESTECHHTGTEETYQRPHRMV